MTTIYQLNNTILCPYPVCDSKRYFSVTMTIAQDSIAHKLMVNVTVWDVDEGHLQGKISGVRSPVSGRFMTLPKVMADDVIYAAQEKDYNLNAGQYNQVEEHSRSLYAKKRIHTSWRM